MFSCRLGNEQDTALSIVDPVQIQVELVGNSSYQNSSGLMDAFNSEDFPPVLEVLLPTCLTLQSIFANIFLCLYCLFTLPNPTFWLFQQIQNKYDIVSALQDLPVLWRIGDLSIVRHNFEVLWKFTEGRTPCSWECWLWVKLKVSESDWKERRRGFQVRKQQCQGREWPSKLEAEGGLPWGKKSIGKWGGGGRGGKEGLRLWCLISVVEAKLISNRLNHRRFEREKTFWFLSLKKIYNK